MIAEGCFTLSDYGNHDRFVLAYDNVQTYILERFVYPDKMRRFQMFLDI